MTDRLVSRMSESKRERQLRETVTHCRLLNHTLSRSLWFMSLTSASPVRWSQTLSGGSSIRAWAARWTVRHNCELISRKKSEIA